MNELVLNTTTNFSRFRSQRFRYLTDYTYYDSYQLITVTQFSVTTPPNPADLACFVYEYKVYEENIHCLTTLISSWALVALLVGRNRRYTLGIKNNAALSNLYIILNRVLVQTRIINLHSVPR